MCGLVAAFGKQDLLSRKIFKQLIQVDVVRGKHSTGVVGVSNNSVSTYKKALSGTEFLDMQRTQSIIDNSSDCLIGHNRYATVGAVNDVNAHPFTHGDVTLVHNGTLDDQTLLPDSHLFDVDSENICYAIDKLGDVAALERTEGAFACIWYDTKHQSFNFVRNSERPLYACFLKGNSQLYVASEREMLYWIMHRNKVQFGGDFKDIIWEIPTCRIHSFKIQNGKVKQVRNVEFTESISDFGNFSAWYSQYGRGKSRHHSQYQEPTRTLDNCTPFKSGDVVDVELDISSWQQYPHSKTGVGSVQGVLKVAPFNEIQLYGVKEPKTPDYKVRLNSLNSCTHNQSWDYKKDPGGLILSAYAGWPVSTDLIKPDDLDMPDFETETFCDNCGVMLQEEDITKTEVRVNPDDGTCYCENCWTNDASVPTNAFPSDFQTVSTMQELKQIQSKSEVV